MGEFRENKVLNIVSVELQQLYLHLLPHVATLCFTYDDDDDSHDPNGSCLFSAGSPTDTIGSQVFRTFSTRQIPILVASGRCRECSSDFLLQCAGDIYANHTDSGIAMDCADRNSEIPHLGV